jgi:hypothetical protein
MRTRLDTNLDDVFVEGIDTVARLAQQRRNLADTRTRAAQEGATDTDLAHFGRAAQRLSETLRFLGAFEESLALKEEAIATWERLGRARASYLVRLQRALVKARLGEDTTDLFDELREELTGNELLEPYYLDFLAEFQGRSCFWCGAHDDAIRHLEEALEFRRAHRKQRIVDHTKGALRTVRTTANVFE